MNLVQSSSETRSWLDEITRRLQERVLNVERVDFKYWVKFVDSRRDRIFSHLNPSQKTIRVFLPLPTSFGRDLLPSPSTGHWKDKYQSVFRVTGAADVPRAVDLLATAYSQG